jgi:hypothetical protein
VAAGAVIVAVSAASGGASLDQNCQQTGNSVKCIFTSEDSIVIPPGVGHVRIRGDGVNGSSGVSGLQGSDRPVSGCDNPTGGLGASGGDGQVLVETIPVTPGDTLTVRPADPSFAGGRGGFGHDEDNPDPGCAGNSDTVGGDGGAGGAATTISLNGTLVLVAAGGGGGGGGGSNPASPGGSGGGAGANGGDAAIALPTNGVAHGGSAGANAGTAGGAGGDTSSGFATGGGGGGGGGQNGGNGGDGGILDGGGGGGGGTSMVGAGATDISYLCPAGFCSTSTGEAELDYTIDATPPTTTIALSPSTPTGSNGWYTSDVTVGVSSADDPGGVGVAATRCVLDPASVPASYADMSASCPYLGAGATVSTDGQHVLYAASVDKAGNVETVEHATFRIDKTRPTISAAETSSPTGTFGANWYDHAVTVTFTCADPVSGIPVGACPADQTFTSEGQAISSIAETVTDSAGNTSLPSNVVTFGIDTTLPTITASPTSNPNQYGWYNHDVALSFACDDALSGIVIGVPCGPLLTPFITAEGAGVTYSQQFLTADNAGNVSAPSNPVTVNIDKTPPTIVAAATTPPDGTNGWYRSDVTVHFTCADTISGILTPPGCPANQVLSSEGNVVSSTAASVSDIAGNVTASNVVVVKIDKTAPVLSVPSDVTVNATSPAGATVSYVVSATDNLDPSPTVHCAPPSGGVFATGATKVTCTATDAAGNGSSGASFTVTVRTAAQQVAILLGQVKGLAPSGLANYVSQVQAAIAKGNTSSACGNLKSFIALVSAQNGKTLTGTLAAQLTTEATTIEGALGC